MTASAFAIGEMLLRRHRYGLGSLAAALAAIVLAVAAAPAASAGATAPICILLVLGTFYLVAVFALGFDTDVAGAGSCYPARMFALPVRTTSLSIVPLLFGAAALAILWIGSSGLVFRPWGMKVPLGWPALLLVAQYSVLVALLWWPFGLARARLVVGVLLGHVPASGTIYAIQNDVAIEHLTIYLVTVSLIGGAVAYLGVARARSGAGWNWAWLVRTPADSDSPNLKPFRSVRRAQAWFEWRRHGRALPGMMLLMVPLCLLPFFVDEPLPPRILRDLLLVLAQPLMFAGMAGASVGKHNAWSRDYYGVSSYSATRPLTTVAMVAAILRAAGRTALVAWAVTLTLTAAAILFSGTHREVLQLIRSWTQTRPAIEVIGAGALVAMLLFLVTWKRLIENLFIGLTGNEWIIRGGMFGGIVALSTGIGFGIWAMIHPEYHGDLRAGFPIFLVAIVAIKLTLVSFVIRELRKERLIADATLLCLGAGWIAFVFSLSALAIWLVPSGTVPPYALAAAVAMMTPLVRISCMPLALHWNRHR